MYFVSTWFLTSLRTSVARVALADVSIRYLTTATWFSWAAMYNGVKPVCIHTHTQTHTHTQQTTLSHNCCIATYKRQPKTHYFNIYLHWHFQFLSSFTFSALTLLLGDRNGIWPVEKIWMLVCWWWWFDCSFARPIAPVVQLSPPPPLSFASINTG